jgi:HAD superfamily phosphatase
MRVLIFDMDGVLVDPTDSYRQTLIDTVAHFSGNLLSQERIVEMKNRGGYNDDCVIARDVLQEFGVEIDYDEVHEYFEKLFWGTANDGMILRERWLLDAAILSRLAGSYRLAVYTGRPRQAARFTLDRFANGTAFDPVVSSDEVENHKPAPDGLLRALEQLPECEPTYVGDNVDDGRCARAAGIPFVGIAAADAPRREEIVRLFQQDGATAVIENINELESVL